MVRKESWTAAAIRGRLFCSALVLCGLLAPGTAAAQAIQVDMQRALCVLLGNQFRETAIELANRRGVLVYMQTSDDHATAQCRAAAAEAGLLNTRLYVERGDWSRIHLAADLADLVVVDQAVKQQVSQDEAMRVLRPGGRLMMGEATLVKPVPPGSGRWSHPYHGPDNNPQADDTLARAPFLTKFLAAPWYGPMPEITLSAGGRLFKAFGHLAFKQREWPMLGKLICLNAYNGTLLWQRDMTPGFMIHRNTLIATDDTFYLGDNQSCKLIDAATGVLRDEIVVPENLADGPVWKWMALEDGVLYALVGEDEKLHEVQRGQREQTGWPWTTVRATYNPFQGSWGFGRTLLAIDPQSKQILWSRREEQPIDSRGVCMNDELIFCYSDDRFVVAVRKSDGSEAWRTTDRQLLDAIGTHERAQDPRLGYWTSAYVKCNDDALYFAGPQRKKLVAVAASDGRKLWEYQDGNVQLVLRDDGLYAMGRLSNSKKFDYLSGKVLADLQCFRGNCTRATGSADSVFARGYRHSGTLRFDVAYGQPRRLPAMRPACQDGVVIANGQLYWGPWMCDCNHSLVGVISLTSAGGFEFDAAADERDRLETVRDPGRPLATLNIDSRDWPTYRADNRRTAAAAVAVPGRVRSHWTCQPAWKTPPGEELAGLPLTSTPAVTAGGMAFWSGADGSVHAVNAATGRRVWQAFTGGGVTYSPALADGRLFVGSADGYVYCFEAVSGDLIWRFRAAPAERKIPLYGRLASTWPVASGVAVQDGVAYAAAGIVSHDGTHVYALDAATGRIRWQNNTSGNLIGDKEVVGVSVQGHLLLHDNKLFMAGGNVVSPAIYGLASGECLNVLEGQPEASLDDHWKMQRSSRGSELFLVENRVLTGGRMLYQPQAAGPPSRYNANYFLQASAGKVVIQGRDDLMIRVDPQPVSENEPKITWKYDGLATTAAIAVSENAVVAAGLAKAEQEGGPLAPVLVALNSETGQVMWKHPLPEAATKWGLAIDRDARILVTLDDGRIVCFATP